MTNLERRRKIILSAPGMFLLYTVLFGALTAFMGQSNNQRSWVNAVIISIPFGLIMTAVSQRRQRKFNQSTGQTDQKKQWALHDAVKDGIMPTDPDLRTAMPAYLESRLRTARKSRINASAIILLISLVGSGFAMATHDTGEGVISVFLLLGAVNNYFSATKQIEKINKLQNR